MEIDPVLERELERNPEKTVDVILVCTEYTTDLEHALERAGFHTTNRDHADHGLIYGRIRLKNLSALRKVSGIESITPDSTQYALNTP